MPSEASFDAKGNFLGYDNLDEHRTTGGRAWCLACGEWCYESQPCAHCAVPRLEARLAEARFLLSAVVVVAETGWPIPLDAIRTFLGEEQSDDRP